MNLKLLTPTILAILLASLSLSAYAVPIQQMYSERVPVNSQSSRELQQALVEALRPTVSRASGVAQEDIDFSALGASALSAQQLLQSFSYSTYNIEDDPDNLTAEQYAYWAELTFRPAAVKHVLSKLGLPFWPEDRPRILVVLVASQADDMMIVDDLNQPQLASMLRELNQRGIPAFSPRMDLVDTMLVDAEQAWSLDEEAIAAIAEKYQVSDVLVGRFVIEDDETAVGQWRLAKDELAVTHEEQCQAITSCSRISANQVAAYYASQFAIQLDSFEQKNIVITVQGIHKFADYSKTLLYLESLPILSEVQVVSLKSDRAEFDIALMGNVEQFEKTLELSSVLAPGDIFQPFFFALQP